MVQLLNEVHGRSVRYVPAEENICATVFGSSDAPTMPPLPEPWMARGDPWVPDGTGSVRRLPSAHPVARLALFYLLPSSCLGTLLTLPVACLAAERQLSLPASKHAADHYPGPSLPSAKLHVRVAAAGPR